ncbi:MAG: hypothetical protein WD066_02630 [Planctomycetaceae bacterium]
MNRLPARERSNAHSARQLARWCWPALLVLAGCPAATETYEQRLEATRREWTEAANDTPPMEVPEPPAPAESDDE